LGRTSWVCHREGIGWSKPHMKPLMRTCRLHPLAWR
jgi:hypothetical protein